MRRTAMSHGFSEEEVAEIYDSRMLALLLKAAKYDRLKAARVPRLVDKAEKKPMNPGAGRASTAPKGINRAMKALNRTGSVSDATQVFAQILKGDSRRA